MGSKRPLSSTVTTCRECGGTILFADGESVCSQCGLVDGTIYSHSSNFSDNLTFDNKFVQCSQPNIAPGERIHLIDGLGSFIDFQHTSYFHDIHGNPLSPSNQRFFSRLKFLYDRRAKVGKHETDYRALNILQRIVTILNLPIETRDRAAYLYRKAVKLGAKKICSTSTVLLAFCLFLAIKESNVTEHLTMQDVVTVFRKTGHRVSIQNLIRASLNCKPLLQIQPKIRRAEDYVGKILQKVLSSKVVQRRLSECSRDPVEYQRTLFSTSFAILNKINNLVRGGRNPYVFAASTIYVADQKISKDNKMKPILTQRLVAEIAGIAEYSVRDHYCSLLKKYLDANIPLNH